ncbi:MAG: hypothetical protein IJ568_01395 [Bacilli bacterium]|nr:hypothetical protein [Bacilli bacterium]
MELNEEELEKITAGLDNMTKEELEALKKEVKNNDELDMDELENVKAGMPLNYDDSKDFFEEKMGPKM